MATEKVYLDFGKVIDIIVNTATPNGSMNWEDKRDEMINQLDERQKIALEEFVSWFELFDFS